MGRTIGAGPGRSGPSCWPPLQNRTAGGGVSAGSPMRSSLPSLTWAGTPRAPSSGGTPTASST
eukprot:8642945-Lingulodinium_polyedra.AAC.1